MTVKMRKPKKAKITPRNPPTPVVHYRTISIQFAPNIGPKGISPQTDEPADPRYAIQVASPIHPITTIVPTNVLAFRTSDG